MEGEGEGRGMGREGGVPEKESIFMSTLSKIQEGYTWLKEKVISFFKLFSESITEALLGIKSFLTSCFEKLREVLSWLITSLSQLDSSNGKKTVVTTDQEALPLLGGEMKMEGLGLVALVMILIKRLRRSMSQWLGTGKSPEMKTAHQTMTGFLDLFEKLIKLSECALEKPLLLIVRVLLISPIIIKKGWLTKAAWHEGKTAMDITALLSLLIPPTLNSPLY